MTQYSKASKLQSLFYSAAQQYKIRPIDALKVGWLKPCFHSILDTLNDEINASHVKLYVFVIFNYCYEYKAPFPITSLCIYHM